MNKPFSPETYAEILETLDRGLSQRRAAQRQLAELQATPLDEDLDPNEVQEQLNQLEAEFQADVTAAEEDHNRRIHEIEARRQTETAAVEDAARREKSDAEEQFQTQTAAVESQYDENTWIMSSLVDESADNNPKKQLETFKNQIERRQERLALDCEELKNLADEAEKTVKARRHWRDEPIEQPRGPAGNREEAETRFDEAALTARRLYDELNRQWLSRLLSGGGIVWVGLILWLPLFGVLAGFVQPDWLGLGHLAGTAWMLTSAAASLALSGLMLMTLWFTASQKTWDTFEPFRVHVNEALQNYKQWRKFAKTELARREESCKERYQALVKHRESSLSKFTSERDEKLHSIAQNRSNRLAQIETNRTSQLQTIEQTSQRERDETESEHQSRLAQIQSSYEGRRQRLVGELESQQQEKARQIEECRNRMQADWQQCLESLRRSSDMLGEQAQKQFSAWPEILKDDWQPPTEVPSGIPLGSYRFPIDETDGEAGDIENLPEIADLSLPAVLPFPHSPSFVLKTAVGGRSEAVAIQQAATLRLMSQLPPATVRLTICDPVGLGEPFSAFMHLADYDELLITNRIWTEAGHIEEQLAKLTEHIENVFQKYLRSEFETIEEYNRQAGEVAEPYRILVVAGFPHGFSERSAQRLASIASSGARCGVYLLLSVDTRQQMPRGFELADVEAGATVFRWNRGSFLTEEYGKPGLSLIPDEPPPPAEFTRLVRKLGELSQSIRRVEVPFHRISPREEEIWKADSRRTVDVALGRSGATKLQKMQLGLGTSQHVLLAGKTGSGKSTLLHVLVTNLALNYSPAELEFYLIDFKKGVEFKAYATLGLPHARVVAIESDREFGVSVLERMDGILKERGELFREKGVQDIQSFRNANPEQPLPRILLVVDEFQEFFTEDDRVFQTASLLLDRLVRQGRAFGIHVLLGSQTLGGAYSLARTTISQMAVRIALQCSETDAHLILSEDNTAARLLTRPGEAIYNDANGRLEGNSLFQIAWLSDEERDKRLRPLEERARSEGLPAGPMIVFEGNLPADAARNTSLAETIQTAETSEADHPPGVVRAWLGEPVSITQPTSVTFRPQPGSHLLIVGTEMSPAMGLMSTALIGLSAQVPIDEHSEETAAPLAYLFNGHAGETEADENWQRVTDALPHRIESVDFHAVGETIAAIREEITRRQESRGTAHPPLFVLVFDLSKFRELAKSDDDFGLAGFGERDKPASPGKLFGEILREGAAVGVHGILWCNSYNNVDRALGRQLLKEFEMRVAFQMSTGDSSSLIETPAAGRLGPNRALLYRDDQGTTEKFRPYGPPSEDWLMRIQKQLRGGTEETTMEEPDRLEALDDISDFTIR